MNMHKVITLLVFGLLFSCVSYEELSFYKTGYIPSSSCINTGGYYLRTVLPSEEFTVNEKHYHPLFFYEDGSFIFDSYYPDSSKIEDEFIKYPRDNYNWGFFKCDKKEVKAEFIHLFNPMEYRKSEITLKLSDNKIIDQDGYEYVFTPFKCKPDSNKNWLKTHRKYRIK